ncbi:bifunctional GNAT family N-acetyltransferase/hotdog fold thioesterase [Rheinheimera metallidurans]|uniref:bifunctional GNAT family N-acetyltransferase/hotdog fold thioesterase n=1 Tax=Rheinheimera metallidurans TaxID=2925781 RepID=UPI003001EB1A
MRHWQLRSPVTEQEWQSYYHLRWQILRAPWQQPVGSEQDQLEQAAYHLMLVNNAGVIAGVGRLHKIDSETAQVRYMAVADEYQGKGVGSRILAGLEAQAVLWQCQRVQLNARETALAFYKNYGYKLIAPAPEQFGIAHSVMHKLVCLTNSAQHQLWCHQLNDTWQRTIPLSQHMQLTIASFNGNELRCNAPLAPNINLHHTMFAGSIYALATLTGWGMLYLQLQALGLQGDQVLAEGTIKYFKPVAELPQARCVLQNCIGDLNPLSEGQKVLQKIKVAIYSADKLAAEFTGRYAVLPVKGTVK